MIEVDPRSGTVAPERRRRMTLRVTPDPSYGIRLRLSATDLADHLRNLRLILPGFVERSYSCATGGACSLTRPAPSASSARRSSSPGAASACSAATLHPARLPPRRSSAPARTRAAGRPTAEQHLVVALDRTYVGKRIIMQTEITHASLGDKK